MTFVELIMALIILGLALVILLQWLWADELEDKLRLANAIIECLKWQIEMLEKNNETQ